MADPSPSKFFRCDGIIATSRSYEFPESEEINMLARYTRMKID